jgi:uncharacterized protein (DUF885 family)
VTAVRATISAIVLRLALILGTSTLACVPADESDSDVMTPDVNTQADRYIAAYFEAFPHQATLLGAADAQHDRLPDLSLEARTRWETTEDSILGALEAIDETGLEIGSPEAITYGFLTDFIRNARAWRMCRMELWNVSPTWTGWQQELALLASSQPIGTPEQNEAAYQRFSGLPHYLEQEVANLREGLSLGYTAPKGNVQSVIAQVDALLEAPVEESPFVAMAPDSLTEFRSRMEQLETTEIRPALLRYRDFLEIEYLPAARDAVSVGAVPDGAACYTAAIRYHATVDMSPEEVHETGLDQMQLIRAEMAGIAQSMIGSDDVDELLRRMRDDPQYQFSSRDEMLDAAESAVARAEAAIPQWFGIVPTADVRVQAVPSFSEPSAPGGFYNPPAEDGSRPGIYYINLYEAETKPRAGLEATAFHETWPGHHLQGAIALEREGLHPLQRYMYLSGFGEGWALYSERLSDEMGLYSGPVDRLGLLSNEALRAARLVVDAGMHALGWTRQQAIDYMLANTAESESSVTAEIDRYIAVPGQATSYMLGNLEIRRLREQARTALGEGFDIRDFHDRILEDGAVPLVMLRAKIERWIEAGGG